MRLVYLVLYFITTCLLLQYFFKCEIVLFLLCTFIFSMVHIFRSKYLFSKSSQNFLRCTFTASLCDSEMLGNVIMWKSREKNFFLGNFKSLLVTLARHDNTSLLNSKTSRFLLLKVACGTEKSNVQNAHTYFQTQTTSYLNTTWNIEGEHRYYVQMISLLYD